MSTKLSKWCEGIIEAGWLAALIIVPLFFNVYSARVFEPDKLSLLRSIALVMAAAWLVKLIETTLAKAEVRAPARETEQATARPGLWTRIRETPLVLPTLLLALAYLISTIFSLAPRISWWGSYQRLQGTYTTLSYIIIFFLILGHLRRREQLERLIYVIILTSVPISIYGIVQHYGLDPLPWGGDVKTRVASNMGNSIFVAAYLIMAFFLTVERLLRAFQRLLMEESGSMADSVQAGCYLFIIVVQLVCIFFTQSRGPWLGLLGGLYVFILLGLITLRQRAADQSPLRRQEALKAAGLALVSLPVGGVPVYGALAVMRKGLRWLWLSWVILSIITAGFLVAINVPNTPLSGFRDLPYVGRLGRVFETDRGTGRVRTLIWEGVVEMIVPHEPLVYPGDGTDRFNALRPLVGHGPEAMWMAYNRFYRPDLAHYEARNASPDRSHNETFDALVITGLFGFAAYISLFTSLFYFSLKWLGAIRTRRQLWTFLTLWFGLGLLTVLGFRLADGTWRFSGVALPAGMILGFVIYVTLAAFAGRGAGEGTISRRLLIITLLATIVAHFIEIHFGIAIAATRTYFWTLSAVLVVVGLGWLPLEEVRTPAATEAQAVTEATKSRKKRRRRRRPTKHVEKVQKRSPQAQTMMNVLIYALLAALVLFTMDYNFINNQQPLAMRASAIFWNSLTTRVVRNIRVGDMAILGLFTCTWLVGMLLALAAAGKARGVERKAATNTWLLPATFLYSAVSLGTFLIFGLLQASRLRPPLLTPDHVANHITVYYTGAFVLLLLIGLAIWWKEPLPPRRWSANGWVSVLSGAVAAVALAIIISTANVSLVKADIYYKLGQRYDSEKQWDQSIALHSKALELAPNEDFYYLFRGRARLEKAKGVDDPTQRQALLEASLQDLIRARELNPLNTDHTANLARLYRGWGELSNDPKERLAKWQRSLEFYEQAITLSPNSAHLYNEYGLVYQMLGEYEKAEQLYQKSLSLDQEFDQTYLFMGELYRLQKRWDEAAEAYQHVIELKPRSVQAYSALGYVYAQQGKLPEAIAANEKVLELAPNDLASHRNLALLYQQSGQLEKALAHARRARDLSPENQRPQMDALIRQIEGQMQ